jgi:hypothetical protein
MVTSVQSRAQQNVDPSKTSTDLLSSWLCWPPLLKNWHRTHKLGTLPLCSGWNHHIHVSYLNLKTTNFFLALVSVFIYFIFWNVTVYAFNEMSILQYCLGAISLSSPVLIIYLFLFKFRWDFHILQQADERKQEGDHTAWCPVISTYHRGS